MVYIEIEKAIAEIDKGDLLVGNNAEWAKEIIRRTPTADVVPKTELDAVRADTIRMFADRLKKYYSNLNGSTPTALTAFHIEQIKKRNVG
jgi:hypothetical protein